MNLLTNPFLVAIKLHFDIDDEEELDQSEPPSALRVARRAVALTALTGRAFLELEGSGADEAEQLQHILGWVEDLDIRDEFEAEELSFLETRIGELEQSEIMNMTWRAEGLVVLAWALSLADVPAHDVMVDPQDMWREMGAFNIKRAEEILACCHLRSRDEILVFTEKQFAVHWRLVDYSINPVLIDFADLASRCYFGPLDIEGLNLIDGDLSIGGIALSEVSSEAFAAACSCAYERHLAANWLSDGPAIYSETPTDT
jgi:Domain of unknown function (DUF4272)